MCLCNLWDFQSEIVPVFSKIFLGDLGLTVALIACFKYLLQHTGADLELLWGQYTDFGDT